MLMRVFLGWLRGERGHCGMVAIPTMEEEDARRPSRERECLVNERSRITNRMKSALARLGIRESSHICARRQSVWQVCGQRRARACRRTLSRSSGATWHGWHWSVSRSARSRRLVPRARAGTGYRAACDGAAARQGDRYRHRDGGYVGAGDPVTEASRSKSGGALGRAHVTPDESGLKRREKGLAKAGNARVRRGVIQLAWRFLMFQKDSALARWYRMRTRGRAARARRR